MDSQMEQELLQLALTALVQWQELPPETEELPEPAWQMILQLLQGLHAQGLAGDGGTPTQRMQFIQSQLMRWGVVNPPQPSTADAVIQQYPEPVRQSVLANEALHVKQDHAQQMVGAQKALAYARQGATQA
ncbi:hypothetical protein CRJUMX02_1910011 [Escherichia coli]|nr:hypothetical protein CRJUMX02_1910011 [Escherichia coli]